MALVILFGIKDNELTVERVEGKRMKTHFSKAVRRPYILTQSHRNKTTRSESKRTLSP